jgi:hypothetical protein
VRGRVVARQTARANWNFLAKGAADIIERSRPV